MVAPSGVRAGAAYVEISADDAPMMRRLRESQARLRQWVAENSGPALTRGTEAAVLAQGQEGGGFLRGGFRGMEIAETGLKLATAIAATKVAIKDVQIFSALFRGDMEGARKAAEELPFGLGQIVKELAGPVDAAVKGMLFLRSDLQGLDTGADPAAAARGKRDRDEGIAAWNRYLPAMKAVQQALDKAGMSAREYARAEVAGMNLAADQAEKLLAKKLRLIEVSEQQQAGAKAGAARERGEGTIEATMAAYAKATMTEEDFLAYEVRQMGLAADQAETLLGWRRGLLEVTREQKAADEEWAEILRGAEYDVKAADEAVRSLVDADQKRGEEAGRLIEQAMTPKERLAAQIAGWKDLAGEGWISPEVYQANLNQALMDAAAAMPETVGRTVGGGVRGTFSAIEATMGPSEAPVERIARGVEETAKNTKAIALAAELGVTFAP